MQIKTIKVNNFKSLVNFELHLAKFTCLVGLNGSGKSTILEFLDFLSQQIKGDIRDWLKQNQWIPSDLTSKSICTKTISFEITLEHSQGFEIKWSGHFDSQVLHCIKEKIEWNGATIFILENGSCNIFRLGKLENIGNIFDYQGSLLSKLKNSKLPSELIELKKFILSLSVLHSDNYNQRLNNQNLAEALDKIGELKQDSIRDLLKRIYPQLRQLAILSLPSGVKNVLIREQYGDTTVITEPQQISNESLRLLNIFTRLQEEQGFALFDNIGNSISHDLIEFLVDKLISSAPQILITTHNPIVLNCLKDSVAIESVVYIYKNQMGATQAIRLFDLPRMQEKLKVMGAGEVYEDTVLSELDKEIMGIDRNN